MVYLRWDAAGRMQWGWDTAVPAGDGGMLDGIIIQMSSTTPLWRTHSCFALNLNPIACVAVEVLTDKLVPKWPTFMIQVNFPKLIFISFEQSYSIWSQHKSRLCAAIVAKWSASSASKLWQVKLARIVRINRGKTPPRPETWGFSHFNRIFNAKIILSSSLASSHVRIPFIIILERNE